MLRFLAMTSLLCGVTFNSCNDKADVINGNDLGRDCSCPLGSIVTTAGSTDTLRMEAGRDIGGSVGLSAPIKKFFQAEVEAGLDISIRTERTTTLFERFENDFSEHLDLKNGYLFGREYACAGYAINCRDKSLSDSELRVMAIKDLDEFKAWFYAEWAKRGSKQGSSFEGVIKSKASGSGAGGLSLLVKGELVDQTGPYGDYYFELEDDYDTGALQLVVGGYGYRDTVYRINPRDPDILFISPL